MTLRRLLLLLAVLVVIAGAWTAYQAWQVSRSLTAAANDATGLQDALSAGDQQQVDRRLDLLQLHSREAAQRTDGTTWSILTRFPAVGDDARGIRLISSTLDDLTSSGIEPLADSAADLESLLPRGGKVPLKALTTLQAPVASASEAFTRADSDLATEDPGTFLAPLRDKYRELAERVSDAASALATADTALQVMPAMLGADGPRDYLLVFQNNAEVRATGGLPGAVSLVHTEDGVLSITRQASGASFGEAPQSVLPLTEAEQQIYGDQLGRYFLDANFTPDFPRVAALMKARWQQEYDDQIDGVLSLDPVALSYLLEATGPVDVGGVQITAENAVDQFLSQTYQRLPDPGDQDAFFATAAQTLFTKITSGANRPRAMLEALQRGAEERRIYVHSFQEAEDAVIAPTAVSGALVTDPKAAPQVGVYLNDTTGAKMSYYLRYDVRVNSTSCVDGESQRLSGEARLESVAPRDAGTTLPSYVTGSGQFGIPPGSQLVTLRIYGPVGGELGELSVNGVPSEEFETVPVDGRPVGTVYVQLDPQRTTDLTWAMTTGPGQTDDAQVSVTPSVEAGQSFNNVATSC